MDGAGMLALVLLIAAGGYVLSLVLHPWTRCRRCGGNPRHYGAIFTHAWRVQCSRCHGAGREVRAGARTLRIGPGKD